MIPENGEAVKDEVEAVLPCERLSAVTADNLWELGYAFEPKEDPEGSGCKDCLGRARSELCTANGSTTMIF